MKESQIAKLFSCALLFFLFVCAAATATLCAAIRSNYTKLFFIRVAQCAWLDEVVDMARLNRGLSAKWSD